MFGHVLTLHQTNTRGFIPICECGWYGIVSTLPGFVTGSELRRSQRIEAARDMAALQHVVHLGDVRAEIDAATDAALKSHAGFVRTAAPVVRRLGRWGNG